MCVYGNVGNCLVHLIYSGALEFAGVKHLFIMQVLVMQQEKSIKQGASWVHHHSISHDSILGKQPMVGSILRADIVLGVGGGGVSLSEHFLTNI